MKIITHCSTNFKSEYFCYQFFLCIPWWAPPIEDGTDSPQWNILRFMWYTGSLRWSLASLVVIWRTTVERPLRETPTHWLARTFTSIWPTTSSSPSLYRRTGYRIKCMTSRASFIQRIVNSITEITVLIIVSVDWFSRFGSDQLLTSFLFSGVFHTSLFPSVWHLRFSFSWGTCHSGWIHSVIMRNIVLRSCYNDMVNEANLLGNTHHYMITLMIHLKHF